jgi:2-oxoglutarate ferredoxin oxidoreductase subunit gamma
MMTTAPNIDLQQGDMSQIRLGGFGGQGIILAGNILGRAAIVYADRNAVLTQSYGPESRGGACMAEVIIADGDIHYPKVLAPDAAVMMSQEAYTTYGVNRPDDCLLIIDTDLVDLDEEAEKGREILSVPITRLAEELGRRIISNMVMLGFVCASTNIVSLDSLKQAVATSVPPGTEELNLKAVTAGYEHFAALGSTTNGISAS